MLHATPQAENSPPIPAPYGANPVISSCITRKIPGDDSMLLPSIAETAGLGRFVYLLGRSKQRYVFSAIGENQISLYHQAIFALVDRAGKKILWVGGYSSIISKLFASNGAGNAQVFVHLLAQGDRAHSAAITDISAMVTTNFNTIAR